jgi:putative copper export protein
MHIFGMLIWLGGLMFQSAVIAPVMQFESSDAKPAMRKINKRFIGFIWMSVWTMLITGILMMLFNPRFVWFHYDDRWSLLLLLKQIIFVLMVFYAFGYARMLTYLDNPTSNGGFDSKATLYKQRVMQYRVISIFLGITALLLSAGMVHFG